ncbi:MAG: isoleucine--tRNA ligase, partial [Bacteroidaceae bacterium]|nr:isoleucine--tRNA ligase [Bacteroidaceae bacterium]
NALIERADVEIVSQDIPGWTVANEGVLTVALDIEITDELRREGLAREIVKRIQNHRKESGFEITDRISVKMQKHPALEEAVSSFRDYICGQVLADTFEFVDELPAGTEFDFEDFKVNVSITK